MSNADNRWQQRFQNYQKALRLLETCMPADEKNPTPIETLALVQAFEMCTELAWNVMKDYMQAQGLVFQVTPKGAIREAFNRKIIPDGQTWLDAIESRNLSAHTYNQSVALELVQKIVTRFAPAFLTLEQVFSRYQSEA